MTSQERATGNTLIVQYGYPYWSQERQRRTRRNSILLAGNAARKIFHRQTPMSSSKGVRIFNGHTARMLLIVQKTTGSQKELRRRIKEGAAAAMVQSGLPEHWWDSAMECGCFLRNVHDKMADGKTSHEKRCVNVD